MRVRGARQSQFGFFTKRNELQCSGQTCHRGLGRLPGHPVFPDKVVSQPLLEDGLEGAALDRARHGGQIVKLPPMEV